MRIELAAASHPRQVAAVAARALTAGLAALAAIVLCTALAHVAWPGKVDTAVGLAAIVAVAIPFGMAAWRLTWSDSPAPKPQPGETVPVAAIGDLVAWLDGGGDVVRSVQPPGLFGLPAGALAGRGLLARVHVSDRPVVLKAVSDVAHGRACVSVTVRLRTGGEGESGEHRAGTGAFASAEMRLHRLRPEESGDAASVIAFLRDVSAERRHAEELEDARLEAERANELKGRFLATVTHELRTPLNAIIGFSELLSAEHPFVVTEERRKEYAQIIRNSGHHLLEIVNTLLDMSKIESGNFTFEPEMFRFDDLAASCCELMQLKADQAEVTLERAFAADLPGIVADRRACRQILINLVSNAVKFTPAGGVVTVSVSRSADELTVCVSDTGIGIPEADLPRLGDAFFQAGDLHRRNHEGTGLGLSVVRGLVGLHRGRLSIESGADAGTSATVVLPIRGESEPGRAKPVPVQTRARLPRREPERKIA